MQLNQPALQDKGSARVASQVLSALAHLAPDLVLVSANFRTRCCAWPDAIFQLSVNARIPGAPGSRPGAGEAQREWLLCLARCNFPVFGKCTHQWHLAPDLVLVSANFGLAVALGQMQFSSCR